MNRTLKREIEALAGASRKTSQDAGLEILHSDIPTDNQAKIAALHTRQDVSLLTMLLGLALARQDKIVFWLRVIAVLLVLHIYILLAQFK